MKAFKNLISVVIIQLLIMD